MGDHGKVLGLQDLTDFLKIGWIRRKSSCAPIGTKFVAWIFRQIGTPRFFVGLLTIRKDRVRTKLNVDRSRKMGCLVFRMRKVFRA